MNKYLPTKSGFTLIELLVVIAIIAVLAVIGIVIFTGQQKSARDARRRSDITAISKALEAQKTSGLATYPAMATNYFSSNQMPTDPTNTLSGVTSTCGTICQYCFSLNATPITNCTGGAAGTTFWTTTTAPAGWTASSTWTVCANLENGTSFCRTSAQ